jgi:phosphate-selective porin OprO/OprP
LFTKSVDIMKYTFSLVLLLIFIAESFSQSTNDILNLLVSNEAISQVQSDSLRAEAAIKQQETDANKKSFLASASRYIQLSGYTQLRYLMVEDKESINGFDIRRARLDIKGSITPYFAYRMQTDFAGSKVKLLDAYGEIKLKDYFIITAGQFKIPFSMENLVSSNKLEMIDRSQVVEALVARGKDKIGNQNGRDIGIQIGGGFLQKNGMPLVEYRLSLFNGSGINIADTTNNAKDIAGRVVLNPAKGLSLGVGYYGGYGKAIKSDEEGTKQGRTRLGFEASYVRSKFSAKGEYILGRDQEIDRAGWYLQAGYFVIPQKLQLLAKYDFFDTNTATADNTSISYVFGGNYNFNNWSRLQLFYTIRAEQVKSVINNYLAIQFQIGF